MIKARISDTAADDIAEAVRLTGVNPDVRDV